MIKKLEGIIIKETDYKETSKIINIFTNDGIIGVMARGVKKIKNPMSSSTSKLTYATFHISTKETSNFNTLIDVDIIDNFKNIRKDITMISYASFILELSYQTYRHEPNEKVYSLCISAIKKINELYDPLIITNIFELKMLDYLGIRPIVDSCAICGSENNIITISSYKGGYICKNCYHNEIIVNSKTIKLLRMFYYVDIDKISKIDISDNIKKELNDFIDDYYERYAGLYLKSKELINNLKLLN